MITDNGNDQLNFESKVGFENTTFGLLVRCPANCAAEPCVQSVRESLFTWHILKGNLIVIPAALQEGVLRVIHYHHHGISKTKAMLRGKVWWPSMNLDIENTLKACHACQVVDHLL